MSAGLRSFLRPRRSLRARWLSVIAFVLGLVLLVVARPDSRPVTLSGPLRINPNTAPPALLSSLPQIGPARLKALLAEREKAPFRSLEDLDARVRGIGPATREALRPHLVFDDNPATQSLPE